MSSRAELSRLAAALGGLPILGCLDGSPAAQAGLRYGDVLLSVDGKPTANWDDFLRARAECQSQLVARIFRDGVELEFALPLAASNRPAAEVMSAFLVQRVFDTFAEATAPSDGTTKPDDDSSN